MWWAVEIQSKDIKMKTMETKNSTLKNMNHQ